MDKDTKIRLTDQYEAQLEPVPNLPPAPPEEQIFYIPEQRNLLAASSGEALPEDAPLLLRRFAALLKPNLDLSWLRPHTRELLQDLMNSSAGGIGDSFRMLLSGLSSALSSGNRHRYIFIENIEKDCPHLDSSTDLGTRAIVALVLDLLDLGCKVCFSTSSISLIVALHDIDMLRLLGQPNSMLGLPSDDPLVLAALRNKSPINIFDLKGDLVMEMEKIMYPESSLSPEVAGMGGCGGNHLSRQRRTEHAVAWRWQNKHLRDLLVRSLGYAL